jgi:pimeloyl-ACP methyl ester carboxylesterase
MMAADLAGLLDAIHIDSAHIVGYSMGVKIAQEFALHYPERVLSLIMACPGSDVPNPVRPDAATINERAHMETLPLEEKVRAFLKHVVNEEFINNNPGLAEKIARIMYEGYGLSHGRIRQEQASGSYSGYEHQPEIKAPTLVIAGSADKSCPAENARILASRIPGAEFVMLEKMRHFFMWEDFDKSNQIMLDFLRRHHRSAD